MSQLLKKLRNEDGMTIIVVEHLMKFVLPLCDRLVVLNHGRKLMEGDPERVCTDKRVVDAYLGEAVKW